jgi:hypothetical protein
MLRCQTFSLLPQQKERETNPDMNKKRKAEMQPPAPELKLPKSALCPHTNWMDNYALPSDWTTKEVSADTHTHKISEDEGLLSSSIRYLRAHTHKKIIRWRIVIIFHLFKDNHSSFLIEPSRQAGRQQRAPNANRGGKLAVGLRRQHHRIPCTNHELLLLPCILAEWCTMNDELHGRERRKLFLLSKDWEVYCAIHQIIFHS